MSPKERVVRSVEDAGGMRCVDIMLRADGRFVYRVCRRDPEDGRGWAVIARAPAPGYADEARALAAARSVAGWLPAGGAG